MIRLFVVLWIVLFPTCLSAQHGQVYFERLDISKGLSHNQVNTIYRDDMGFVWLGTMSGLNRYDGYNFKVFRNQAADPASISDNYIHRIFSFPKGKMMIHTRNGANIYDPLLERFNRSYTLELKQLGLPDTAVEKIVKDREGNHWFVFYGKGLWGYTASGKAINYGAGKNSPARLGASNVADVAIAPNNRLWLVYDNGMIELLDWHQNKIIAKAQLPPQAGTSRYFTIFGSRSGDCWLTNSSEPQGAFRWQQSTGNIAAYNLRSTGHALNSNIVTGITEDLLGNIWITTDHGGINLVDANTGQIQYLLNNPEDNRSISQNSTVSLYNDNQGIIWVGTYKQGVNYFNQNVARFPLYKHLSNKKSSLPYEDVNRFAEDAKANLWIGTNGGGLVYFDRGNNTFKQWLAGPGSISNNVIVSLCIDHQQRLWIGSYFGGLDCYDGKQFVNYRHNNKDTSSLNDDRVMEIFEDSRKRLWIGTLTGGLNILAPGNTTFQHLSPSTNRNMYSGYVSGILEDNENNVWVGTAVGIHIFSKEGIITHLQNQKDSASSLSNNNVVCMLQDSRGYIWVGTREGLNIYNKRTRKFRRLGKDNGLPDNTILTLLEDGQHNIWVSTPNGLSQLQIDDSGSDPGKMLVRCKNYNELNNLQGREFNEKSAWKTRDGELLFGGAFGFNIFKPAQIIAGKDKPSVVLTDLEVFNKPVKVGDKIDGEVLLSQSVTDAESLTLKYNQNVFSIAFAALDFPHTEIDKYAYTLDGFNTGWLTTDGSQRKATFTNLDPGQYTFRVRSVNNEGIMMGNEATLSIHILPPFWKTNWAFALYVVMVAAGLWLARLLVLRRARMRFAIEQERQEAKRMRELDLMKIRFITNVSHEFRTPLSLIITPADKLIKAATDPGQKKQFQLIHRNARRLLNLVNQLLDFRKLEVQEFSYQPTGADIVAFTKEIAFSFTDIAENKHIQFSFQSQIQAQWMKFDADKLEKILFNLLSNAYKFTPDGGQVTVLLDVKETRLGTLDSSQFLEIKVADTGIGMPADKTDKVFERFFQHEMPGDISNQGSGIGLAIAKEFVKLHNGTIAVESEPDKGSCFTVRLPIVSVEKTASLPLATPEETTMDLQPETTPENSAKLRGKRATVLIVEDNEDFRFYLKDNLGLHFHIAEAANGKEGWQLAQELQPDLVVSDIMMPVMNGLELAKKIKNGLRTATIPVILLTARTAEEQELEGLDTGANDYITKPFSFEILLSRIKNQLSQQKVSKKPTKQITVSTTDVEFESGDEKTIKQALEIVEKNMGNPEFSVEELSRELLMSRVGLYKKILALTGKTPIAFIKDIRMERAKQLLEKSELNISEIAYEVGFNDPKYFAKTFKKDFGVLPSAYVAAKSNNQN